MIQVPYYPLKRVVDSYSGRLQKAASRVVESGWYIRGEECRKFEANFAEYCGAKYCVGVGNGLEALSLILKGYIELGRLEPGDGVIVPSNTFIATWLAVKAAGLVPVPAEPDADTCVLTLGSVEQAFLNATYSNIRVKAILAVHLYGRLCPMDRLKAFAEDREILLLEDAAQAHGATMDWNNSSDSRRAGNLGDAAGFSFYPGKNLGALGDAGAVVTNDEPLAQMVRKIANYGSEKKYVHECVGENSRLDEIQAAVLSVKLPELDEENARRNEIAGRYLSEIRNPLVKLPLEATVLPSGHLRPNCMCGVVATDDDLRFHCNCVWHIFPVHCGYPDGTSCRDALQLHLAYHGIETLIHYPTPPHLQKAFVDAYGVVGYPIAEKLAREELSLPLHPFMTEVEIQAVIDAVNSFEAR
ncbi:DegT/DnrJ/EryC1/StrS aminotransferase family protein [Fibrobacter sp. UWEL]|uniref:DegT/DnrJ/EryC1/StrS family aminotransferase n=1 Tax=Fibrobacter sp. UWEL TaxID=1896209 RepID=UPI00091294C2|nr:DegT/DnrJ/EryC1/StrS family aminotransferase [Fibrobacter sp. UWEL]SHK48556.1 dTDP-4-amino-4,6-dideoxygalactose transaminase [Fibrobacter sp. UWEL]